LIQNIRILSIIAVFALLLTVGCSRSKNPVEPSGEPNPLPDISDTTQGTRQILSAYDVVIDPAAKTFTLSPVDRSADYHVPVSKFYPDVLSIVDYGWTPNFWADIKIKHPFPLSAVVGFDPRVIAIIPANDGVSFFYPTFNVRGNNKALMNSDGYTPLWDDLGGNIPGNVNPFMAYFKEYPYRTWEASNPEDTRRFEINLAGFGGPMQFKLVVDVSTNYPQVGIPIQDNAPEPVGMKTEIGNGLASNGGNAAVEVILHDWQGSLNIKCKIEAPELFTGAVQLVYSYDGSNPHEYIFTGNISNDLLAAGGEYRVLIAAWDIPTNVHIYCESTAIVQNVITDPIDVTPPSLNFSPWDIAISGNYMYVAAYVNGLHIFDISNPESPSWVNKVDTENFFPFKVYVKDGYAYLTGIFTFLVIDVDPPESAHLVKSFTGPAYTNYQEVYFDNGYAYINSYFEQDPDIYYSGISIYDIHIPEATSFVKVVDDGIASGMHFTDGYALLEDAYGFRVMDIDPPEDAHIVKEVGGGWARDIAFSDDYAYIANNDGQFHIIDINPPESSFILNSISIPEGGYSIDISNGYAYLGSDSHGLIIIDIDPPELASIIQTVPIANAITDIIVSDGYAYAYYNDMFTVFDIDPPETASRLLTINMPESRDISKLLINGDYAYICQGYCSIHILDINPPGSSSIVNSILTTGNVSDVFTTNGYAFVTNPSDKLLEAIDIDPPQDARIIKTFNIDANMVDGNDDYIYLIKTPYNNSLYIYNINPIDSMHLEQTVVLPSDPISIAVCDGYAYMPTAGGLMIVDIDPVDSAHYVSTASIPTRQNFLGVDVLNGYAYIASSNFQSPVTMYVVDIDPPESPEIVKTIETTRMGYGVSVFGNNAFLTTDEGFYIIDITHPEDAYIVNHMGHDWSYGVFAENGYAFVTVDYYGLQVIDVDPPESAYIIKTIDLPDKNSSIYYTPVHASGRYAYVANGEGGLRIIKLF